MNDTTWAWLCATLVAVCRVTHAEESIEHRWIYLQQNLQVTDNIPQVETLLRRAKGAGYNGVVLADYKLNILDRVPEHYFTNAARVRDLCAELDLDLIPCVASFGYSSGILAHNPNLAEGLPVQDAPFVVRGGRAVVMGDNPNLVPGEFEAAEGNAFRGWSFQDEPGAATFVDTSVKHGGRSSLRIENPRGVRGNRRVSKLIAVRPWAQYHAAVWIKTSDFESAGDVRLFAMSPEGRVLSHSNLGVKPDQDWTEHHVVFNSLEHDEVRFYLGVWDCGAGQMWIDDARVVEEPLVNLVRRPGCPLTVTSADGAIVYEEGRDFAELRDEKLGVTPWAGEFDVYHEPPALRVLPGSRINDGDELRVSYYHAVTIYDNQVPCSLSEEEVFEIVADQTRRIEALFHPRFYFLSHDEIRVANWSEPERASGRTAGETLAANVRRCVEIVREVNPDAKLCIWSDMFDPHHNAVDNYYLVNGTLAGSWEGLPEDVIVVNWNHGAARSSLAYFAERGNPQVLAGFYDSDPAAIREWIDVNPVAVNGVMYTTWRSNFAELEAFAKASERAAR
jgi:hypothetical protein